MKKITKKTCFIFILTSSFIMISNHMNDALAGPGGYGGGGGIYGIAQREIIRRQEMISEAQQKIIEGDEFYKDKDYEQAVSSYRSAVDLLPPAQVSRDIRVLAIRKYASASIKLGRQRADEGDYDSAASLAQSILSPDIFPNHKGAKKLLKDLQDPEIYTPAMTPEVLAKVKNVERLLELGQGNYNIGEFDKSTNNYYEVLNIDKYNKAARSGMERVNKEQNDYYKSAYAQTRAELLKDVTKGWELPVPKIGGKGGNSESFIIPGESGSARISSKIKTITFPKIVFNETPVSEAIQFLQQRSKDLDPDRQSPGVSLILDLSSSSESSILSNRPVSFNLENVPLEVALDYTTKQAGLKFKVEDYAVTILPSTEDTTEFKMRRFRVPPSFFKSSGGGESEEDLDPFASNNETSGISTRKKAKDILIERGVGFPDGSSAYYNTESSILMVYNTPKNLSSIEALVSLEYEKVPKQVYISTKFLEVAQENLNELGFDWLIGPFNIYTSDRVFGSGGTSGSQRDVIDVNDYPIVPPGVGRSPIGNNLTTAGLRSGLLANKTSAIDGLLNEKTSLSSLGPAIAAFSGVFTDPQFQMVIRGLNQKRGTDLLSAPSITAKSGQTAKIQVVREFIYATEYDPPTIPNEFGNVGSLGGGLLGTQGSVNTFPVTPATPTTFDTRNVGITLEVNPQIGPDGYTIDMELKPETVEFEGFVNYGTPIRSGGIDAFGNPTTVTITENEIKMPIFAVRSLNTNVTLWDGHTVALGGLIREDVSHTQDRVPLLGSLPIIGRLFRSESELHVKKNLIIFVSGEIIDASGQRLNKVQEQLNTNSLGDIGSLDLNQGQSLLFP